MNKKFVNNFFFKLLFCLIFLNSLIFSNEIQTYSICVCTTSNLENAMICKNNIKKSNYSDVFIIKENQKIYRTFLGSFSDYSKAEIFMNKSSDFVKKQKPFIKKLSYNLKSFNHENKQYIDINKNSNIFDEVKYLEEFKILEDFKSFGSVIIDRYSSKMLKIPKVDNLLSDYAYFDNLLIEVDSSNNIMKVSGKSKRGLKLLKTYKVSTAKKSVKKPLGQGNVTSIALNPIWYPTQDTIESFKKRGIELPSVVLGGDKLNYMGSAKINLTHKVDGKETFRIHGTIDESTIGSYESSGCIRMKNSEVIQLVEILNKFIDFKSMEDIKVILK